MKRKMPPLLAAMGTTLVLSSGVALADAKPNAHNCLGSFSSSVTPAATSHNALGPVAKEQGQGAVRGTISPGA